VLFDLLLKLSEETHKADFNAGYTHNVGMPSYLAYGFSFYSRDASEAFGTSEAALSFSQYIKIH